MKHRDEVIALLSQLNPEVHPHLVLQALEEGGYDIVRKPQPKDEDGDGVIDTIKRKVRGK